VEVAHRARQVNRLTQERRQFIPAPYPKGLMVAGARSPGWCSSSSDIHSHSVSSNRRIDLNQPRPGHPRDTANVRAARRKPAVAPRSVEIPDRNGQPCGFVRDTGAGYIGSTSGPQPCRPLAVTPTDQFATRGWPALDQSGRAAAAKKSPALGASQNVGRRKLRSESLARPFFGSSREAVVACSNVFHAFLREGVFHLSGARACSDSFCHPESRTAFLRFHRAGLHA
jgi:hypothetical protein